MQSDIGGDKENLAYLYDGSLEGLLSAIFAAYANHVVPTDIACAGHLQPRLGQVLVDIDTNLEHASRVQAGLCRVCGTSAFEAVKAASLSDDPQAGTITYHFIRHAMKTNKAPDYPSCPYRGKCFGNCRFAKKGSGRSDIAHPAVEPFNKIVQAVGAERHRILQFLRFEHMEGDLWFARCNPKASVVPLVMDWFVGRFNTQAFMIYDEVHHIAGVYEGRDWYLVKTEKINLPSRSSEEKTMRHAWKRFYDTVAVESRFNPELRRQFMPKRFWRNIVEMQEEIPRTDISFAEEAAKSLPGNRQAPALHTPVPSKGGMKLSDAVPSVCQK